MNPIGALKVSFESVEIYGSTSLKLFLLRFTNSISKWLSVMAFYLILLLIVFLCVALLSVALGFWLGEYVHSLPLGFLLVALAYALIMVVIVVFRKKWIQPTIL